ncbi:MAG: hypothetical protein ACLPN6_16480 [Streptosporangiaceae bacterium]|jgi:hypothetical protein
MSFPAPDDGRPPPAPQHAVAWDVRTPLQLHVHRAVRLLAAVGGYGAGLCLIIGMVALVAVDARPGRQTHITAAAEQHSAGLTGSGPGSHPPSPPAGTESSSPGPASSAPAARASPRPPSRLPAGRPSAAAPPGPPTGRPAVLASFTGSGNQVRLPLSLAQDSSWGLQWSYRCPGIPAGQLVIAEGTAAISGALVDQLGTSGRGSTWAGAGRTPRYLVVISSCTWAITVLGRP